MPFTINGSKIHSSWAHTFQSIFNQILGLLFTHGKWSWTVKGICLRNECTAVENAQIAKMSSKMKGGGFTQSYGEITSKLKMKRTPLGWYIYCTSDNRDVRGLKKQIIFGKPIEIFQFDL